MKPLPLGSYLVRPFKTYKNNQYSYTFGQSNNINLIDIDEATPPPAGWLWSSGSEPLNPSGLSNRTLYESVTQIFYPDTLPSGGAIPPMFDRGWEPSDSPSGSYVINIAQNSFGEQIRPGTFALTTPSGSGSIRDDGQGRLFCSTATSSYVGNIFYPFGLAVIGKMNLGTPFTASLLSHTGMFLATGSRINIAYTSQLTLFEHRVNCTLGKGEYNFSTNPSLRLFSSSSVSGSFKLWDQMLSGSLTPYVTTIGLYTSLGELVAIGKVPRPLRRVVEIDQTFVVKFDI